MEIPTLPQSDNAGANPSSAKSDDSSPRPDSGRGSPPPNCAICLGTCRNKSFTDSCLHQFCFKCLLTWSKVKAECPLCKQNFKSIIHNVRSNHQYEEYMVEQRQTEEITERIDIDNLTQRFRYRTTLTLPRRETMAIQQLLLHYPMMDVFPPPPPLQRAPPARRRRSPASFRRTVYRHNLWARPLPDFTGRFRDCTPEFYRYNDTQMHRLVPWLNRELHYLLNENVGHISYVMTRILELLPQYHINSNEFKEAMERYFGDRTEHFLHELYCFASTPYDMTGYDRNVQYTTDTRISTMINEVISSSESEASVDSDIVMVTSSSAAEQPPGPSRPQPAVHPQIASYFPPPSTNSVIPIETISHSDTDDDSSEVMVVGYIKPPQDRTPEVVDLLGSDSDVIVQETVQPESTQAAEVQTPRSQLVKVSLKRHRSDAREPISDSDDSTYTPPPPTPRPRKRRRRSIGTRSPATTTDTCRTTPSPDRMSWDSGSTPYTTLSNNTTAAPESSEIETSSDSSSEFVSFSTSSAESTPRVSRKKKRKTSISSSKKKNKKRKNSRGRRKDKSSERSESVKRNKSKSHSGKGVKSSCKRQTEERSLTPPPLDQPSTSAQSDANCDRNHKSQKEKKRRRDSRETRRLKSVVNVIREPKQEIDASANSNLLNILSSAILNPQSSYNSDSGSIPGDERTRRVNDVVPREILDIAESCFNVQLPEVKKTESTDSSDPEDNIPLNLTIQRKKT